MQIRDCNKDNKWHWVYITTNSCKTDIHFNGTVNYVFDKGLIKFIRR